MSHPGFKDVLEFSVTIRYSLCLILSVCVCNSHGATPRSSYIKPCMAKLFIQLLQPQTTETLPEAVHCMY